MINVEIHITNFMFNNVFQKSCRVWDNMGKYCTAGQVAIWRVRIACCIPEATNKHSEYVLLLVFSVQQWLHQRASTLCHAYFAWIFLKFRTKNPYMLHGQSVSCWLILSS